MAAPPLRNRERDIASIRGLARTETAGWLGTAMPTSSSSPIPRSSQTIPSWVAALMCMAWNISSACRW